MFYRTKKFQYERYEVIENKNDKENSDNES